MTSRGAAANRFRSSSTSSPSTSIATTRCARSRSFAVSAPRPGPISITSGSRAGHTAPAMRFRTESDWRKCCPSFRGTPPLAPHAVVPGKYELLQAPCGLPAGGGRDEFRIQNHALHFGRQLAAVHIPVLHMAGGIHQNGERDLIAGHERTAPLELDVVLDALDRAFRIRKPGDDFRHR